MTSNPSPLPEDAPAALESQPEIEIPTLVAQVYEAAPAAERARLVETLLRPLGLLSLVAIAGGIFAKIRFRNAGQDLSVRIDDLRGIQASDVVALVHHAQQVSVETVDGLVQILSASGAPAKSAAAALLIGMLVQRARSRRSARIDQD